jgi:hypothetical protein
VTSHCSTYLSALSLHDLHSVIPTHTSVRAIPTADDAARATVTTTAVAVAGAESATVDDCLAVKGGYAVNKTLDSLLATTTAALTTATDSDSYKDTDTNSRGAIGPDPEGGGEGGAVTLKKVLDLQMLILVR